MAVNAKNWQELKKPNALERKPGTDVRRKAVFGLPHRRSPANQVSSDESHPIHQTQELPGSALRLLKFGIGLLPLNCSTQQARKDR